MDLWTALVGGRWTFVDRFDSDGRRYLLACKNTPEAAAPVQLGREERQVVAYVTLGHSNKLIAYELGRSEAWVSATLRSALKKLGLRSRVELAKAFHALRRS
jgi:DNA-binding NarL/FixJ family response regulator